MTDISSSVPGSKPDSVSSIDSKFLICKGVKPDMIRGILHETGYQADIEEINGGYNIASASNGTRFLINLQNFDEKLDSYKKVSISASYSSNLSLETSVKLMNGLNARYSFIKGCVEGASNISIRMDWLVGKGVSVAQLTQWIAMWRAAMILFEDYWSEYEYDKS